MSVDTLSSGRLRVLHLYAGNLYGGIETLLVTLARYRDLGAPMVPEFGLCFHGRLWDELEATGAGIHDLGDVRFSRPWTVWRARTRLRALLTREQFDVVVCHACWPHALFGPVVRRCGLPLVFWAHDVATGTHWLERRARRTRPDLVLANSRFTASSIADLFPAVPTEVQYLPVAPPPPMDREAVRQSLRRELGARGDAVVILIACRLERWKGHAVFLDALGRLRDVADWQCWIAGGVQRECEQEYLAELRVAARRFGIDGRVRFLGHRPDGRHLFAAADIHCQPNTRPEPFGVAFVEALYAGIPVVTAAIGGALEIVDESCGRLVRPGDAADLAEALRELLRSVDLRSRLGSVGTVRAANLCDPASRLSDLANRASGVRAPAVLV